MKRDVLVLTLLAVPALAQLAAPNSMGVSMGHVHLAVTDIDAHKQFWTQVMGGTLVKNGPVELIQFPGVFIMLRKGEPTGPPAGSVVNHFGFVVKDMPAMLAKWKSLNLKVEPTENPNEAYVFAPDSVRVEVYGVPNLPVSVQMNHIHYASPDIPTMKAWYTRTFGAIPGERACVACVKVPRMIDTGDLPGVNLSFSGVNPPDSKVVPTKGRALDHIGFEVKDLEAFVRKYEAQGNKLDVPIREVPNTKLKIAFLTDPWGTYIELTQGLAPAN